MKMKQAKGGREIYQTFQNTSRLLWLVVGVLKLIGCFLEGAFVKLHLSHSEFSLEKNMLPLYFAHKVM